MKYIYQARDKDGKIESGTIEASSKDAAADLLSKYNIFVTSLVEEKSNFLSGNISFLNKVSKKDLAIFSRQLAVLLDSRVPVVQSLRSLAEQTKKKFFREKIMKIAQLVDEGNPLSEAFSAYPEVFSVFYINLIKSGEASGKISETLNYLSKHLEREADINSQIKGAMIYPAFVISVLLVVVVIVIFVIMPKLIDLIKQSLTKPPFFTMLMINFYGFLTNFWWVIVLLFGGGVISVIYYFRTQNGKRNFDIYSLRVPMIGDFFQKTYLVRFAENLTTLISAGLPITQALKITKDTVENYVYKEIISQTEKGVSEGEKISSVLRKYPKFVTPFVIQMVQVGEDTGKLDKNLEEIVNFYQKEIERSIDVFMALLEPMLIIFLGVCVAILAVSVLSPLYNTLGGI